MTDGAGQQVAAVPPSIGINASNGVARGVDTVLLPISP
jgi:hypothetical protein